MENINISQGDCLETLKHFIYLTNEYGLNSEKYLDSFINLFGTMLANGEFKIGYRALNKFWEQVIEDCKQHNTKYNKNMGSLFYYILQVDAMEYIKEHIDTISTNKSLSILEKALILLKEYIEKEVKTLSNDKIQEYQKKLNRLLRIKNYTLINKEMLNKSIQYNGKEIAIICTDTQVKANGCTYDIGEYIETKDLNLENITIDNMEFNSVYEETVEE